MSIAEKLRKIPCSDCGTTVAERQGDVLVLKIKHHGQTHTTAIYLPGLDKEPKPD